MKNFCVALSLCLLVACGGVSKKGASLYDEYDAVRVDQMVGNNVTGTVFEKVILCLNARRETRTINGITNVSVQPITNLTVLALTNQTISVATNYQISTMTNLVPPLVGGGAASGTDAEAVTVETNLLASVTNAGPSLSTNVTFSLSRNQSATASPSQSAANNQFVRTYNNQLTTTSNNLTIALMTNIVVTAETNQVVTYATNIVVANVTNVTIVPTNVLARDYYLFAEYTPPPDFTLQSGESLVLLIDGVRYGFTQTPLTASYVGRKGYVSVFYRVPPDVLVALANAKEVRVRLKGSNATVERAMTTSSRQNFRTFLLKYFVPEPPPKEGQLAGASN
jgi:hypothetical protein